MADRRSFLETAAMGALWALSAEARGDAAQDPPLGLDNFAVRARRAPACNGRPWAKATPT